MVSTSSLGMHVTCFLGTSIGGAIGAIVTGANAPLAAVIAGSSYILNHTIVYLVPKSGSPPVHLVFVVPADQRVFKYNLEAIGRIACTIIFATTVFFKLGIISSVRTFAVLTIYTCTGYYLVHQLVSKILQKGLKNCDHDFDMGEILEKSDEEGGPQPLFRSPEQPVAELDPSLESRDHDFGIGEISEESDEEDPQPLFRSPEQPVAELDPSLESRDYDFGIGEISEESDEENYDKAKAEKALHRLKEKLSESLNRLRSQFSEASELLVPGPDLFMGYSDLTVVHSSEVATVACSHPDKFDSIEEGE